MPKMQSPSKLQLQMKNIPFSEIKKIKLQDLMDDRSIAVVTSTQYEFETMLFLNESPERILDLMEDMPNIRTGSTIYFFPWGLNTNGKPFYVHTESQLSMLSREIKQIIDFKSIEFK
jgi:hypothetical protein